MQPSGAEHYFEATEPTRSKAEKRRLRKAEKEDRRISLPLEPRTPNQRAYLWALQTMPVVIGAGEAGSGKTYLAARMAVRRLIRGEVDKIVITRPTIANPAHRLGFLPGGTRQKMAPWLVPVIQAMGAEVPAAQIEKWMQSGQIEILPFEMMRGRSVERAVFLLDEAQNCTLSDLKLFLTRTGEGTQVIMNGDPAQADISNSGFSTIMGMVDRFGLTAAVVRFGPDDVVRSEIAREWVRAFHTLQKVDSAVYH